MKRLAMILALVAAGAMFNRLVAASSESKRAAGNGEAQGEKVRCKAIMKSGVQCKSLAKKGSELCWLHSGMKNVKKVDEASQPVAASAAAKVPTASAEAKTSASPVVKSRQCDFVTEGGNRCAGKAVPGGSKCWRHAN